MALHRHGRAVSVAVVVVALMLCLAVVSAVTSALAASPSPAGSPSGKVILRLGFPEALDSLNPFVGYSLTAYEVYHLNYDFLVGYKASDLSPAPELATSWSSTPDGKTWTFKVRTGVKWQDGVPFTAKDVAFTYNYIIDNQLSAYLNYVSHIKNVEAVNDQTVIFHLTKPKANMLRLWVPIIPEHIWSKISGKAAGFTFLNQPPVIGTGPFQVVENKPGSYVRLVANEQYWRGAPKIDEVILETFTNPIAMADEVQAGQLDGAEGLPPASFEQLSRVPGIKTSAAWVPNLLSLSMNCYDSPDSLGNPVLLDVRFRQALNWAIDKDAIIKTAYFGHADPASTIICNKLPSHWEPPASIGYGFDLAKASQLLTQAGYKLSPSGARLNKKGKPITLRLMATSDNTEAQSAAKLIAGWFQEIGLKITLSVVDEGTYLGKIYNLANSKMAPDYDLELMSFGEYPDPDAVLSWYTSSQIGGWSDVYWSNAEYDRLYVQQGSAIDPAKRTQLVDRMQEIFYRESPAVILLSPRELDAYNVAKWEGWVESPTGSGAVFYTTDNIDSYLSVHPTAASTSAASSLAWLWPVVIIAAVAVVLVGWFALRRRGQAIVTEE